MTWSKTDSLMHLPTVFMGTDMTPMSSYTNNEEHGKISRIRLILADTCFRALVYTKFWPLQDHLRKQYRYASRYVFSDYVSYTYGLDELDNFVCMLSDLREHISDECLLDIHSELRQLFPKIREYPFLDDVKEFAGKIAGQAPEQAIMAIKARRDSKKIRKLLLAHLPGFAPELVIYLAGSCELTDEQRLDIAEYLLAELELEHAYRTLGALDTEYANRLRARIVESMAGLPIQALPDVNSCDLTIELTKLIKLTKK